MIVSTVMSSYGYENSLAVSLFGEILALDQLVRARLAKVLPKGMELSHFSVLNQLSHTKIERTPAQIAKSFRVTRGAITNTLNKLELSGYIHVRPDWDDARRKMVSISPAGIVARNNALTAVTPIINELVSEMGEERLKAIVPILRELRQKFE